MSAVKRTMKPAVMSAFVILGVILVTSEVVALVETSEPFDALAATPISQPVPVDLVCPSNQTQNPGEVRPSSLHLNRLPGDIYETLPYAILLKRTSDVGDNCVLNNPKPLPRMPIRHPNLRLIPASPVKK
jgi:hypothetical protein